MEYHKKRTLALKEDERENIVGCTSQKDQGEAGKKENPLRRGQETRPTFDLTLSLPWLLIYK
jgi:hypothetical protein